MTRSRIDVFKIARSGLAFQVGSRLFGEQQNESSAAADQVIYPSFISSGIAMAFVALTNFVLVNGHLRAELFQSRGWSQHDFAEKSGLDVRTIAKVKRGGSCDASTLQRLATALGTEPKLSWSW